VTQPEELDARGRRLRVALAAVLVAESAPELEAEGSRSAIRRPSIMTTTPATYARCCAGGCPGLC
jgi:hypothetical protein